MRDWGVSEYWMPFVSACLFFLPLLLFLWLLDKLPPPSVEDEALRTKRQPMLGAERLAFVKTFAPGLVLLILSYALLTAFRDFGIIFPRKYGSRWAMAINLPSLPRLKRRSPLWYLSLLPLDDH